MYCMKCGREIPERQVFCPDCLADMARYPVDSNLPVQLPRPRKEPEKRSASRRKAPPTAEQRLARMKVLVVQLLIGMVVLVLALGLTILSLFHTIREQEAQENLGRNYTTVEQDGSTGG